MIGFVNRLNKLMKPKGFCLSLVACLLFLPVLSSAMVFLHIPVSKNQVVAWRQLEKINSADKDIDTIILGDSSAGFAIDIEEFNRLTGLKALNLSLTAPFGIQGSILMLARAKESFPGLKNVLFIFSAPAWMEGLNHDSYFLLRSGLDNKNDPFTDVPEAREARKNYLGWLMTPKRLFWFWKNKRQPDYEQGIWDPKTGYILQGPQEGIASADEKWAKRMPMIDESRMLPYMKIWSNLCKNLNCLYAHGPQYSKFIEKSDLAIDQIDSFLVQNLGPEIRYERDLHSVGYDMLGDAREHIRPDRIKESTQRYASIINKK